MTHFNQTSLCSLSNPFFDEFVLLSKLEKNWGKNREKNLGKTKKHLKKKKQKATERRSKKGKSFRLD